MTDSDYDLIWNAIRDGLDNGRCPHGTQDPEPCIGCATRAVLAALTTEGRLLPADAETQWGVELHPASRNLLCDSEVRARALAQERGISLYRREIRGGWVGPWRPVPAEEQP